MTFHRSARGIAFLAVLATALIGCAPKPPELYPLNGTVIQNGKQVTAGGLIFIPESGDWGGLVVNAAVNRDGTFTAETSRTTGSATTIQSGVPAGRYKVAYHPPGDGQKVGMEYHFPEPIAVEAKANSIALTLPEHLPNSKAEKRDDPPRPDAKPKLKTGE